MPIWKNGICAMVADKAQVSDSRDTLGSAEWSWNAVWRWGYFHLLYLNHTMINWLLFFKGYQQITPFVSVNTALYTKDECDVIYNYFLEKNWISASDGPEGNEAKKQLMHLSAFNPEYFDRICAMSWKLSSVVPQFRNK